jgi:hypothetical protein
MCFKNGELRNLAKKATKATKAMKETKERPLNEPNLLSLIRVNSVTLNEPY